MDQSELKHTWRFPAHSKYIRFFAWLWAVDKNDLTFCALFWGSCFAPFVLPLRVLYVVTWGVTSTVAEKVGDAVEIAAEQRQQRQAWRRALNPAKPKRPSRLAGKIIARRHAKQKPSRRKKALFTPDDIAQFFARSSVRKFFRLVFVGGALAALFALGATLAVIAPTIWFGITTAVAAVGTGVAWFFTTGLAWFFTHPLVWLAIVGKVLAVIAVALVGVALVAGAVALVASETMKAFARGFGNGCGNGIAFLIDGAYNVKRNTCPRIVLDDGDKVRPPEPEEQ